MEKYKFQAKSEEGLLEKALKDYENLGSAVGIDIK